MFISFSWRRVAPYLLFLTVAATTGQASAAGSPGLKIVAANYPLAYFAERLAGARARVVLPVPTGADPAFWQPSAETVGEMQKADLILLNGAGYEKWLPQVSLPRLRLANTSLAFRNAYLRIENAVVHSHGPGGRHAHEGSAFTTWLDFDQAGKQAQAVADAIVRKRPEWKSVVTGNLKPLLDDLAGLDAEMKQTVAADSRRPLLASHPVYQYLARRYGLNLKSVHWEPDEMPPAAEWSALRGLRANHSARWMIWEAQPAREIAAKLKTMGIESVVFDPCANRPEDGDFLTVMKRNMEELKTAYR
ncbi:MAG: metal ABC transporter substrate-binding protein [Methylocaldum sp.]|nr:metal ABC transporter substrate-binding protein [Methylocaldum sp.]